METRNMPGSEVVSRIESCLREDGIDTLLIVSREDSDGVLPRILDVHVVAQTALFFNATGRHIVLTGKTDAMAYEDFPFFNEVVAMREAFEVEFPRVFERLSPRKLALNICEEDASFDGLRWGLYAQLRDIIGAERLAAIELSSADILRRAL